MLKNPLTNVILYLFFSMQLTIIQKRIYEIEEQKVMLDSDLAELYEVETGVLNQTIKRNIKSFPKDFMFRLTEKEWKTMSSQFVMTYPGKRPKKHCPMFSQNMASLCLRVC